MTLPHLVVPLSALAAVVLILAGSVAYLVHRRRVAERYARELVSLAATLEREVHERRIAEQRLAYDAQHDSLTSLPNRARFGALLDEAVAENMGQGGGLSPFAVLFVDLDRFKLINDSLGHAAGDELLVVVARRLRRAARADDIVARFAGDEFTILARGIADGDEARELGDRIRGALLEPVVIAGQDVVIGASIGVALCPPSCHSARELLQSADVAMYRAKRAGRGRTVVFDAAMVDRARSRLRLEAEMRRAVEHGELEVHYQPIASLRSGAIHGFEALVRWRHPNRGLLNAASFIPIAEETGLIGPIGEFVLSEACRQAARWDSGMGNPRPTVAVNLSVRELARPTLAADIERALSDCSLDPSSLRLEVTESALLEESETLRAGLLRLQDAGVRLHLDDLGTGYSSLSYLHRLPFAGVKIDRYFVNHVTTSHQCREIVRSIVSLADRLGLEAVAEGAETREQRVALQTMRCPFVQGYVVSRPVPPEDVGALLAGPRRPSRTPDEGREIRLA